MYARQTELTTAEAAAGLGVSIERIHAIVRAGELPVLRRVGRAFLFRGRDVARLRARRLGPRTGPGRPPNRPGCKSGTIVPLLLK